jgi:DNA-binding MarR family transcriptional regulator
MTQTRLIQPKVMDDLFLYRISRLLATAGAPVVRVCEGEFGITRREWRIVALLAETEGILSSDLAVRAQLDRARTSRAVTGLVAKKLVSRTPRPGDRRAVTLALTAAGRSLFEALFPRAAAINVAALSALDAAEVVVLDKALTTLQRRADAMAVQRDAVEGPKAGRRQGGRVRRSTASRPA